jgi:simple sugar transport system permease protein
MADSIAEMNFAVATVAAAVAGGGLAAVLAVLAISRRADQIIVGIMINLLALGLTNFLYRELLGAAGRERVTGYPLLEPSPLVDIPGLGPVLFRQDLSIYVAYAIPVVATWILFRTTWGLKVQAVGEYPLAADTAGISVRRVRYLCVIFSGVMAGLGGAALVSAVRCSSLMA